MISVGLHFRYETSYNNFSVNPNLDRFRNRFAVSCTSLFDAWESVKFEVLLIVQTQEKKFIHNVLWIIEMAISGGRGSMNGIGFKNLWNFNLSDVNFGSLFLDIKDGQIASEQRSEWVYKHKERSV